RAGRHRCRRSTSGDSSGSPAGRSTSWASRGTHSVRIAYVSADRGVAPTGSNGASTHIRELVNAVVARGAEVKLLTPRPGDGRGIDGELIDIDTDDVLPALRRLTAGIDGGSDAAATQRSEERRVGKEGGAGGR